MLKVQQEEIKRQNESNELYQRLWWRFSIFHSKTDVQNCYETHKTTGSESLLRHNHLLLRMTVLLCNRNVCACLSSICGGICFILCSLSVCQRLALTQFKCYFYLNTQRELGRKPISVCKGCLVISANFRWQIVIIFIKTASKDDCQIDGTYVFALRINDCRPTLIIVFFSQKKALHPSVSGGSAYKNHLCWKPGSVWTLCLPCSIFHKVGVLSSSMTLVKSQDYGHRTLCILDGSPSVNWTWGSRTRHFRFNLIATVCFTMCGFHTTACLGLQCGRPCSHKFQPKT